MGAISIKPKLISCTGSSARTVQLFDHSPYGSISVQSPTLQRNDLATALASEKPEHFRTSGFLLHTALISRLTRGQFGAGLGIGFT